MLRGRGAATLQKLGGSKSISRGGVVDEVRKFEEGGVVDGVFRPDFEGGGSR